MHIVIQEGLCLKYILIYTPIVFKIFLLLVHTIKTPENVCKAAFRPHV